MAKFWCSVALVEIHLESFLAFIDEQAKARSSECTPDFVVWVKEQVENDRQLLKSNGTQDKSRELFHKYTYENMLDQYHSQKKQKTLIR